MVDQDDWIQAARDEYGHLSVGEGGLIGRLAATLLLEREAMRNLLARIHRDGGQHTEAVGLTQSVADADAQIVRWLQREDD